jgi:hypothetical protein
MVSKRCGVVSTQKGVPVFSLHQEFMSSGVQEFKVITRLVSVALLLINSICLQTDPPNYIGQFGKIRK